MATLETHPTVKAWRFQNRPVDSAPVLEADWLRRLCLEAGADDVGFVSIDRPAMAGQRKEILDFFPAVKTLISLVVRMNREPIRSPARSVANLEFHHSGDQVNEACRRIVSKLEERGVRAVNPAMGFPMEMDRFPGKTWLVSHKPVAEAAGLGKIGIHRNLIHPRFGNFVLLGTVLLDAQVEEESQPIDYNPCLECKLCVAACPVGAISPEGEFDFSSCYTHNYREFMGGFTDWVEQVAESRSRSDYRQRVSASESASMWQSLSFGANYKAAYCMSVCPAGEEVIGPFLANRSRYLEETVRPLQKKAEPVYVTPGSDAEEHVAKRFPNKWLRRVSGGLRPQRIEGFLNGLPLLFQKGRSKGIDARFHFVFTGKEPTEATVVIRNQKLLVERGLNGEADLRLQADSETWLAFVRKEKGLLWALLTRRVRVAGSPRLLKAFGRCFPS